MQSVSEITEEAKRSAHIVDPTPMLVNHLRATLTLFLARSRPKAESSRFSEDFQVHEAQKMLYLFHEIVENIPNTELHRDVLKDKNDAYTTLENASENARSKVRRLFPVLFFVIVLHCYFFD